MFDAVIQFYDRGSKDQSYINSLETDNIQSCIHDSLNTTSNEENVSLKGECFRTSRK